MSVHRHKTPTQHISQKSLTDQQTGQHHHHHARACGAARLGVTFFVAGFASTTLAARLASLFLLAILPPKYAMSKWSQYTNGKVITVPFHSKPEHFRIPEREQFEYMVRRYERKKLLHKSFLWQTTPHCGTWMVHLCRHHTVARRHRNRMC